MDSEAPESLRKPCYLEIESCRSGSGGSRLASYERDGRSAELRELADRRTSALEISAKLKMKY